MSLGLKYHYEIQQLFSYYPITQQIGEKAHALTRFHPSGEGSRVKDLVDILLMAELGEIDGELLVKDLQATLDPRQTHLVAAVLPDALLAGRSQFVKWQIKWI